jgi:hypothetical protein
MKSLYPPEHPVLDGLLRAMTEQTVCVTYNDVSLQTADLKYVCADLNKGRKVIHAPVTDNAN